ncbi:MAG: hypothetical protein Q7R52_00040, partial [archaeon]|nr:hypothetical protein [archaeon]
MKKGVKLALSLLAILIPLLTVISASFTLGNYSIKENYASQDYLEGWINISFKDEPADSNLSTNMGDSLRLVDFLNKNSVLYSCVPKDCKKGYTLDGEGETTKTFSMVENEEKVIGLMFTGKIISINSINFTIQSNAQKSCNNQLKIDILNDNNIDTGNNKVSAEFCENS